MHRSENDQPVALLPVHRPMVGVGAVVRHGGKVLLVQRGRAPGRGTWAVPGGKVKWGETLQQAAERELLEETGVRIRAGQPIYVFDAITRHTDGRVRFHYVVVDLDAEYIGGQPQPGDDARDARWVAPAEFDTLDIHPRTRELLATLFQSAS